MDHLPPLANPYKPIIVPYLGGIHNNRSFTESLARSEVDFAAVEDTSIPLETRKAYAPLLQAWFFFGLLQEILDLDINQDDFIVHNGTQQVITTIKLKWYLAQWKARNDPASEDHEVQARRITSTTRIINCLQKSYEIWNDIPDFADVVGSEVELSIHILASTLEFAAFGVLGIDSDCTPWRLKRSDYLNNLMANEGWCPALVWQIGKSRLVWQYYCYLLGPPRHKHTRDDSVDVECKAGDLSCSLPLPNTDSENYQPQHVCPDKRCDDVSPSDLQLIENTVLEGGIPLLEYNSVTNELFVKKYERGDQYTALSHVWTDGLGNPGGNTMPKCQLKRLNDAMAGIPWTNSCLAASLKEDIVWQTDRTITQLTPDPTTTRKLLFWTDTICVPQGNDDLRKLAISNMCKVYNRANRVLVFDSDLTHIEGIRLSAEEVLSRISLSPWLRRFWTLQEAVLAKVLWFQFHNTAYRDMSHTRIGLDTPLALYNDEVVYYCKGFNFDWHMLAQHLNYTKRVAFVWDALNVRVSTKKLDQPICIATLLDMEPSTITAIQDLSCDDRFKEIWFRYTSIPTAVIFIPGPRLTYRTLRWAPEHFTSLGLLPPPGLSSSAIPTRKGLAVTHHGIITTSRLTEIRHGVISMYIPDPDSDTETSSPGDVFLIRQNDKQSNPLWTDPPQVNLASYPRLAVLLAQAPISHSSERQPLERALGALVGISEDQSDVEDDTTHTDSESGSGPVLKVTYLRTVSVLLKDSVWETLGQRPWTKKEEEEKEKKMWVGAEWTHARQRWLIT